MFRLEQVVFVFPTHHVRDAVLLVQHVARVLVDQDKVDRGGGLRQATLIFG